MPAPDDPPCGNPDLPELLPGDARLVVEVGGAAGALGERCRRVNPQCRYVRIDCGAEGEVEPPDPGTVDCLVYGEGLEYRADPAAVLRRLGGWVRPGGVVLACVPNVQHWAVLRALLCGRWEPPGGDPAGRGPRHFFTLDGIQALFAAAGLEVTDVWPRVRPATEFRPFVERLAPALQALGVDPDRFAAQAEAPRYLVRAVPAGTPVRRLLLQTLRAVPEASEVRVAEPNAFVATVPGVRAVTRDDRFIDFRAARPGEDRVVILQRVILSPPADGAAVRALLRQGYLVLAETDDDPLRRPEHTANRFFTFRCCHGVQNSTEPLAAVLRPFNPNVAVFPNQVALLPPPRPPAGDGPVTLFFGALNRETDWQPILPALNRVLADYRGRVRVRVVHDRLFYEALHTDDREFEPWVPYGRYLDILGGCDVALLPLEPTRLNRMKSDVKFLQCAAHGVVVLASPTVYEESVVEGETGFLYHSPGEFEARLRQLLDDGDLRRQVAGRAYRRVAAGRLLGQHYRQRHAWYVRMLDALPRLNEELKRRAPELFGD